MGCSWVYIVDPRVTHGSPMGHSWASVGIDRGPTGRSPMDRFGSPMEAPLGFHGFTVPTHGSPMIHLFIMGRLWAYSDPWATHIGASRMTTVNSTPIGYQWVAQAYELPLVSIAGLWVTRASPMGSPWVSHGSPMGCSADPWATNEWVTHRSPMNHP